MAITTIEILGFFSLLISIFFFSRTPFMSKFSKEEALPRLSHDLGHTVEAINDLGIVVSFFLSIGVHLVLMAMIKYMMLFLRSLPQMTDERKRMYYRAGINYLLCLLSGYAGAAFELEIYVEVFLISFTFATLFAACYYGIDDDLGLLNAMIGVAVSTAVRIPEREVPWPVVIAGMGIFTELRALLFLPQENIPQAPQLPQTPTSIEDGENKSTENKTAEEAKEKNEDQSVINVQTPTAQGGGQEGQKKEKEFEAEASKKESTQV